MNRALFVLVAICLSVSMAPVGSAHTPITVEIIEPSPGEVVITDVVRVSLRARSGDPAFTSTVVHIRVDELWFDPASSRLTRDRPAFGGLTINADQTKQVRIEGVASGRHELRVSFSPHPGETPVVSTVPFEVSQDAAAAKRRGSNYFLFAVLVLGAGALWLQLSWRRRMSRS